MDYCLWPKLQPSWPNLGHLCFQKQNFRNVLFLFRFLRSDLVRHGHVSSSKRDKFQHLLSDRCLGSVTSGCGAFLKLRVFSLITILMVRHHIKLSVNYNHVIKLTEWSGNYRRPSLFAGLVFLVEELVPKLAFRGHVPWLFAVFEEI